MRTCRRPSRWLPVLFALLFAARALVPAGYMVAVGPEGGLSLTLCSGLAAPSPPAHTEHLQHGGSSGAGEQDARPDPCPFALAGATALAHTPPPIPLAAPVREPPAHFGHRAALTRPPVGAHGARAPPSFS